jgi:TolB-like protein/Tfp pilus assembly protein PilF
VKRCPKCRRAYNDDSLNFCLDDGDELVYGPGDPDPETAILNVQPTSETPTRTFETPPSARSSDRVSDPFLQIRSSKKTIVIAFFGVVLLALLGLAGYQYVRQSPSKAINSIAVLPFENNGGDADTDYLSDGLTDSLMYRLSQLPNLSVSPRSTVFKYKGKGADPIQIGNDLGVSAVLSGRIIERGDDLTVSVELVDIRRNKLLWGEQYNRKMSDLLATQREIAQEITEKLRLTVAGTDPGLAKHYTENNEAYQLYLKGRFYWEKRSGSGLAKAIEYLDQSIKKDPTFALAYAGLADCYVVPANQIAPNEAMPKAKAAAQRALELDETLAEAHTALARVFAAYEWNWPEAEKEFKRAIELNPRYPTAHQWYGGYLDTMGRHDESISERRLALQLDPLSLILNFELAQAFYYARDYDGAVIQYRKTLEMEPNFPPAYQFLPVAYEQKGDVDQAIALFLSSPKTNPVGGESSFSRAGLAHAYALKGQKQEALNILKELESDSSQTYIPATSIALVYAGLGDNDHTFEWLEKAYQEHAFQLQWLNIEPRWDGLRSDPRFGEILRRIRLS